MGKSRKGNKNAAVKSSEGSSSDPRQSKSQKDEKDITQIAVENQSAPEPSGSKQKTSLSKKVQLEKPSSAPKDSDSHKDVSHTQDGDAKKGKVSNKTSTDSDRKDCERPNVSSNQSSASAQIEEAQKPSKSSTASQKRQQKMSTGSNTETKRECNSEAAATSPSVPSNANSCVPVVTETPKKDCSAMTTDQGKDNIGLRVEVPEESSSEEAANKVVATDSSAATKEAVDEFEDPDGSYTNINASSPVVVIGKKALKEMLRKMEKVHFFSTFFNQSETK